MTRAIKGSPMIWSRDWLWKGKSRFVFWGEVIPSTWQPSLGTVRSCCDAVMRTLFLTSACEPLPDQIRRYGHDAAWAGDSNLKYWNAPVTRNNINEYHYCFCHILFNVAWSISLDENRRRGQQNVTVASVLRDGTSCTLKPDQTLRLYFYHIWRWETSDHMRYSSTAVQIRQRFVHAC
jgi:hypothetical protein